MLISFYYPNLPVRFDKPGRELWLIDWMDEHGITGDGEYERIGRDELSLALFGARFDSYDVERFLMHVAQRNSLFDLAPNIHWMDPSSLLERLLEKGDLVAVRRRREQTLDAEHKTLLEEQETVRSFTQLQKSVQLIPGRRCVLVSGADYNVIPNRERYQVVGRTETTNLLKIGLTGSQVPGHARGLLDKVIALLASDWRPPQLPKGLVLLRELAQVVASQTPEVALTPSQIRALKDAEKKIKLEVVVLGADSKVLKLIEFAIETPDSDIHEGDLGPSGRTKVASAKQGATKVTLRWTGHPLVG